MKRRSRDILAFDSFDLLAQYAQGRQLSLRDNATIDRFLADIRDANERRLSNDAFVHGRRVEAMFESIVASLGRVALLKQEDAGEMFYTGPELVMPDFRVVTEAREQFLIEVKNHYQKLATFSGQMERIDYLDKLSRYAALTGAHLLFATYWTQLNLWTLVTRAAFQVDGAKAILSMEAAVTENEMFRLGDRFIGTRAPLRLRLHVHEVERCGNERTVIIDNVELLSEDRLLAEPVETELAMFLLLNSRWEEEQEVHATPEGAFQCIEHVYSPPLEQRQQDSKGFEMVGPLSSMLSNEYRTATAKDDRVESVRHEVRPGRVAQLLPDDYHDGHSSLPIWLMTVVPKDRANSMMPHKSSGRRPRGTRRSKRRQ